jgi:hypothetical protein
MLRTATMIFTTLRTGVDSIRTVALGVVTIDY